MEMMAKPRHICGGGEGGHWQRTEDRGDPTIKRCKKRPIRLLAFCLLLLRRSDRSRMEGIMMMMMGYDMRRGMGPIPGNITITSSASCLGRVLVVVLCV